MLIAGVVVLLIAVASVAQVAAIGAAMNYESRNNRVDGYGTFGCAVAALLFALVAGIAIGANF